MTLETYVFPPGNLGMCQTQNVLLFLVYLHCSEILVFQQGLPVGVELGPERD
jgi:hypothetical protein